MASQWYQNANQSLKAIRESLKGVADAAEQAQSLLDALNDKVDDIESGWNDQTGDFGPELPEDQKVQAQVAAVNATVQQLQSMPGMQGVAAALQKLVSGLQGEAAVKKQAALNPVTMQEEFSKELLISESAMLMEKITASWPDLVIDDISQTMVRAFEYKNGKIHTGEVRWHITVGSVLMGIARQVEITMPVKEGFLEVPQYGKTPLGEEVKLEPIAFSNWCRLGVK